MQHHAAASGWCEETIMHKLSEWDPDESCQAKLTELCAASCESYPDRRGEMRAVRRGLG